MVASPRRAAFIRAPTVSSKRKSDLPDTTMFQLVKSWHLHCTERNQFLQWAVLSSIRIDFYCWEVIPSEHLVFSVESNTTALWRRGTGNRSYPLLPLQFLFGNAVSDLTLKVVQFMFHSWIVWLMTSFRFEEDKFERFILYVYHLNKHESDRVAAYYVWQLCSLSNLKVIPYSWCGEYQISLLQQRSCPWLPVIKSKMSWISFKKIASRFKMLFDCNKKIPPSGDKINDSVVYLSFGLRRIWLHTANVFRCKSQAN